MKRLDFSKPIGEVRLLSGEFPSYRREEYKKTKCVDHSCPFCEMLERLKIEAAAKAVGSKV